MSRRHVGVWAVSLAREVRVVIVDYLDSDKNRQTRKVFFSTDTSMSARDIFDIYRTRFQLEFVDAKQFTGFTHCHGETRKFCRLPSTPRSLSSTSPGHLPVSKGWTSRSVQQKHCCTTLQWWIDLLQCPENLRTCD